MLWRWQLPQRHCQAAKLIWNTYVMSLAKTKHQDFIERSLLSSYLKDLIAVQQRASNSISRSKHERVGCRSNFARGYDSVDPHWRGTIHRLARINTQLINCRSRKVREFWFGRVIKKVDLAIYHQEEQILFRYIPSVYILQDLPNWRLARWQTTSSRYGTPIPLYSERISLSVGLSLLQICMRLGVDCWRWTDIGGIMFYKLGLEFFNGECRFPPSAMGKSRSYTDS